MYIISAAAPATTIKATIKPAVNLIGESRVLIEGQAVGVSGTADVIGVPLTLVIHHPRICACLGLACYIPGFVVWCPGSAPALSSSSVVERQFRHKSSVRLSRQRQVLL
jgi:hypothetical protein